MNTETEHATNYDQFLDFAFQLAPELEQSPLYFLKAPIDYPMSRCAAFAARGGVDHVIREELISKGVWRGQGNAVVFRQDFDAVPDIAKLPLVVHEAAHLLPFIQPQPDREPSSKEIERDLETLAALAEPPPERSLWQPWEPFHGPEFIRYCLHLADRSWNAGRKFPYSYLVAAGEHYGLGPLERYAMALGDEPNRMAGATFAEIASHPAPRQFVELFECDVELWKSKNNSQEKNP